ncbi:hypothetical protein [Natronobacterium texcoconense]|uniref:Uncharacterized protein n=1 Tax=Natronobacterium texcoconense TaxID=1095778 RepID=A0A1H1GZW0_NATTX|nr:hypothetical protein [Natronobacterium texcoconense]SDR18775.1 hypothetical protein SAMN04489842_2712 [Natronobacterium texcoconense]
MTIENQVQVLVVLGLVVLVVSLLFPVWSLSTYSAHVQSIGSPPDDATVIDSNELTPREQTVVAEGKERSDAVEIYGYWGSHQHEDSALPFSGHWFDTHTVGAVVDDGSDYYRVEYDPGGAPIITYAVTGFGFVSGLVVYALGVGARASVSRGWSDRLPQILVVHGLVLGVATLLGLLWIGNASGYLWPVQ